MTGPSDVAIQGTNDDATSSKAYAVRKGYWTDSYIKYFSTNVHKPPEINRGYFIRTMAFRAVVISFIKSTNKICQVINLGAGADTLFFNLRDMDLLPEKYVEIDLESNVQRKAMIIERRKLLNFIKLDEKTSECGNQKFNSMFKSSDDKYYLINFDLRHNVESLVDLLCNLSFGPRCSTTLPTLFLAECVLVYIPSHVSTQLIKGLGQHFRMAEFLNYEQVNMKDSFGAIMIQNFRARSCELIGLEACESLKSQEQRFLNTGWLDAKAWTINEVYQLFSANTRSRIDKIELLDDVEITHQLYNHFCFVHAINNCRDTEWSNLHEQLSVIS